MILNGYTNKNIAESSMLVSTVDNWKTHSFYHPCFYRLVLIKVPFRLKIIETKLNRSVQIHT